MKSSETSVALRPDALPVRQFLYSAKDNAFYLSDELHLYEAAGNVPTDLNVVSESTFEEFALSMPPIGKTRVVGDRGLPCWGDQASPSNDETSARNVAKRDALMRHASSQIAPLQDAVDLGIHTASEFSQLEAWKQYRVLLNRLAGVEGYPLDVDWPDPPHLD